MKTGAKAALRADGIVRLIIRVQFKARLKPLPHVSASLVERRGHWGICELRMPAIATIALRLEAALQASRTSLSSKPNEIAAHYILDACGRRGRYSKAI